jgi:hypothetical protein
MSSTFDEYRAQIAVALRHAHTLKLSAEARERVGVGIKRARRDGISYAQAVPRLAHTLEDDKVAQPIIDQLNDADTDLSVDEVRRLEALVADAFPRAPRRPD